MDVKVGNIKGINMSKWFESEHLREELSTKWEESIKNAPIY